MRLCNQNAVCKFWSLSSLLHFVLIFSVVMVQILLEKLRSSGMWYPVSWQIGTTMLPPSAHYPENRGSGFVRNIGTNLPDDTRPIRETEILMLPWGTQILVSKKVSRYEAHNYVIFSTFMLARICQVRILSSNLALKYIQFILFRWEDRNEHVISSLWDKSA
jgi:hypothetical protein